MLLAFGSFVTAAVLAGPVVVIESALDCPAAGQVSEELERIVPNAAGTPPQDRALLSSEDGVLLVHLRAPDGTLLGERRIVAEGSCNERARAVAVILGTWLTDIHPEYRSALPLPAPAPEQPTQAPAANPPAAAPSPQRPPPLQRPAPLQPAPLPARLADRDVATSKQAAARRWSGALAIGFGLSEAGAVLAGALSASYAPERTGLGAAAFAVLTLPAERSLGSGTVSSFRWPLGAGPLLRVQGRRAFFDVSAGPMVGWLHVAGEGFSENRSADDAAAGAFGRVRLGLGWPRFRPFVEAGLLGWFGAATAVTREPETEFELPAFESFVLAGMAFAP
jgi:hypothetical protein